MFDSFDFLTEDEYKAHIERIILVAVEETMIRLDFLYSVYESTADLGEKKHLEKDMIALEQEIKEWLDELSNPDGMFVDE